MHKSLIICVNKRANPDQPSCGIRGSIAIADALSKEIENNNFPICIIRQKCLGMCSEGPNLKLAPGGKFYNGLSESDIPALLEDISVFCKQ